MNQSMSIRENLIRIRNSQSELLQELKNEHRMLEGFMGDQPKATSISNMKKSSENYDINLPLYESGHLNDRNSEYTLELSKSEGMGSVTDKKYYQHSKGSTNAETILENNYKKIEELLLKQRHMQEQNHALQEENQSLMGDYREIKNLYYQSKERQKGEEEFIGFAFKEILSEVVKDLLLNQSNSEILAKSRKKLKYFISAHPNLFIPQGKGEAKEESSIPKQVIQYLESIFSLLSQNYKVERRNDELEKKEEIIEDLKKKISELLQKKEMQAKHEQIRTAKVEEERMVGSLRDENQKLNTKIRQVQKQSTNKLAEEISRRKDLEKDILNLNSKILMVEEYSKQKDANFNDARVENSRLKIQRQQLSEDCKQLKQKMLEMKEKLIEKEHLYSHQLELAKKQNQALSKMSHENSSLNAQVKRLEEENKKNVIYFESQEQRFKKDHQSLRRQMGFAKQHSEKEIASLNKHLGQIKKQYESILKSEEIAKQNELKYRELAAQKGLTVKLRTNVDHLWEVKEIQYGNIMQLLSDFH